MTVDASAMKAMKLVSALQHRVAVPLYSLSFPKKFSIGWHHLHVAVELGREVAVGDTYHLPGPHPMIAWSVNCH